MVELSKQKRKHEIGMAGEYLVAGELMRRGITAAVTYGNAKKADVIAVSGKRALHIEVKSTQQPKWVVGPRAPAPDQAALWIFVYLPIDSSQSPQYFIVEGRDLHLILKPKDDKYLAAYRSKHGKEFSGNGVCSIKCDELQAFKENWAQVSKTLERTS